MAKTIYDEVAQIHFVPAIADPDAPELQEIEAGVDLSCFLRPGGDWSPMEGSTVDAAVLCSRFNATVPGTYGGQPFVAVFTNDDEFGGDVAWNALPRRTRGFFVTSFYQGSGTDGALDDGDIVNVWPGEVISRKRNSYARNELATFEVQFSVNPEPSEDVPIGGFVSS